MGEGGVIQADRDAAAEWIAGSPYDVVKAEAEMIRIGQLDNHRLVQAFARHRQAAEKATRERDAGIAANWCCTKEASGVKDTSFSSARIATAIRSQNDG